jgi:hypothetical protein
MTIGPETEMLPTSVESIGSQGSRGSHGGSVQSLKTEDIKGEIATQEWLKILKQNNNPTLSKPISVVGNPSLKVEIPIASKQNIDRTLSKPKSAVRETSSPSLNVEIPKMSASENITSSVIENPPTTRSVRPADFPSASVSPSNITETDFFSSQKNTLSETRISKPRPLGMMNHASLMSNAHSSIRPTSIFVDDQVRCLQQPVPNSLKDEIPLINQSKIFDDGKKKPNIFREWIKRSNPDNTEKLKRPIFGVTIQEAVKNSRIQENVEMPSIIYRCIEYLDEKRAWEEEGIYRLSGAASVISGLRSKFDEGNLVIKVRR